MDELKSILTKLAPALGGAVGGPLGTAVVAILAEVLGTKASPDAVTEAIKSNDPEVVKASLARAEAAYKAEIERQMTVRTQIDKHVEMMRLDYSRGIFYSGWRPLSGWISVVYAAMCCLLVVKQGFEGTYGFLAQAPSVLMIGGPVMALAGVYAFGKSRERVAMSGSSDQPSLVDIVRGMLQPKAA